MHNIFKGLAKIFENFEALTSLSTISKNRMPPVSHEKCDIAKVMIKIGVSSKNLKDLSLLIKYPNC